MADSRLITEFINYKLTIQGRSQKTVDEYYLDLRTFFRYLVAKKENLPLDSEEDFEKISTESIDIAFISDVTPVQIMEFLTYCVKERKNSAAARSRKLSAIKGFFKYLTVTKGALETNPAQNIEAPQKKKALPKYLTLEECQMLLAEVINADDNKMKVRDYAILVLFINCGMRLSELCGISLKDIDRDLTHLRVLGKGNKERIIYLNSASREALANYLSQRENLVPVIYEKDALFISRLGKRISNKTVQWTVYKYLGLAGLDYKHFSTHKLRHTAATLMYQTGKVDVLSLKEILGHEQLSTTQIYTHINDSALAAAVENHPLANFTAKKDKDE